MIKITIKTIPALAAALSIGGGPLFKTCIFGTIYLIISYSIWYWGLTGGFFEYIRKNGFSLAMFSAAFMFLLPTLPITALALIMEANKTADTVISAAITAAGLGCFIRDCVCLPPG